MAIGVMGAFLSQFNSGRGGLSDTVNGQLYFVQAPAKATIPFVVMNHDGETPEWTFESAYKEQTSISLTVYVPSDMEQLEAIVLQMKECFDWIQNDTQAFIIDGARVVKVERTNYKAEVDDLTEPGGELVYKGTLTYEVIIRRILPN